MADAREVKHILGERVTANTNALKVTGGPEGGPKRCSFCRKRSYTIETCFKKQELSKQLEVNNDLIAVRPKFACYGCNAPGVVRANCQNSKNKSISPAPMGLSFNALGLCIGRNIPVVDVQLFG